MAIKWTFISNQDGEVKGINDSGVATFRGTPLKSLAREICQNSLDAFVDDAPVVVEFHSFDIPVDRIPGAEELRDAFARSRDYWSGQKTSQTRDFFETALKEYDKGSISVLRISDFNTKGLRGSHETRDTDWTNLTKSSGVSDKHGTAGGSYGIGKYATFACSRFSTVFYSTYDMDGVQAYQGVSRIVTFTRADGEDTTGLGFYGEDKNKPVYEQLNLDTDFSRSLEQYGTDIYIMAFAQAQSDWKREIVLSILDSFFVAFWKNKLKVVVDDIEISAESLPDLMNEYKDSVNTYVYNYYKVLTSKDTKWIEEDFYGLGATKFGVLLMDDDASRRVAMVRKTGMKIKDQGGISGYIPFMAVMLIEGDEINERLRLIENPQHTEWEPQRSANEQKARELLKALNDYMKKKVACFAEQSDALELEAVGLSELIPEITEDDAEKVKEENVNDATNDIESRVIIPKERKPATKKVKPNTVNGTPVEGQGDFGWGQKTHGPTHPQPHQPKPISIVPGVETKVKQRNEIDIEKFIFISPNRKLGKYILKIVPAENGKNGVIELNVSGEVFSFPAIIKSAALLGGEALEVDDNRINGVTFEKGKQVRVSVELESNDYCALEVSAYAD